MLLSTAIDQFIEWKAISARDSTVKGYANDLKIFCLLLKNRRIQDIELDDLMAIITDMMEAGWTNASMMRKCMALRKLFEFMEMRGYDVVKKQLIPVPKPEPKLPRVISEPQFKQLLASLKGCDLRVCRNRAIIRLLWDTGMRAGEILTLNISDLNLPEMYAVIRTEKNRGSRPFRRVYWTPEANLCLKLWLKRRVAPCSEPALFTSCTSWKAGQRFTPKGLGEMLRRQCQRAGLPTLNPHSFRHALGHRIIARGGSNSDVANLLGHVSILSTLAYTQLNEQEVKKKYRRFS